jgi:hypothetical protein
MAQSPVSPTLFCPGNKNELALSFRRLCCATRAILWHTCFCHACVSPETVLTRLMCLLLSLCIYKHAHTYTRTRTRMQCLTQLAQLQVPPLVDRVFFLIPFHFLSVVSSLDHALVLPGPNYLPTPSRDLLTRKINPPTHRTHRTHRPSGAL